MSLVIISSISALPGHRSPHVYNSNLLASAWPQITTRVQFHLLTYPWPQITSRVHFQSTYLSLATDLLTCTIPIYLPLPGHRSPHVYNSIYLPIPGHRSPHVYISNLLTSPWPQITSRVHFQSTYLSLATDHLTCTIPIFLPLPGHRSPHVYNSI